MFAAAPGNQESMKPSDQSRAGSLVMVLAAIFALRAAALTISPLELGFDEAQYWAWSQHFDFGYFTKPPLIAWLIGAGTQVCGDGAACVRFPALLLNTASAFLVYFLAKRLYDARTGFWAAVVYALIPGIAVSSFLITTDVPLTFCWILALIAFSAHERRPRIWTALLLGLAMGLGLNAKYAMIYFPICAALYMLFTPQARPLARSPLTWLALAIGLLLILPNLGWNYANGFATFHHTSDNIGWQGVRLHPVKALEFIVSQFGLMGPVVFGAYLVTVFTGRRTPDSASDRLLLWFSLPIFILITLQALQSRAHANWAATAIPAAVVLTTAQMLAGQYWKWFRASLAINGAIAAIIAIGAMVVTPESTPRFLKPVYQLFGSQNLGDQIKALAGQSGIRTVVAEGRILSAELTYALRDSGYQVRGLAARNTPPGDHFQMEYPWYPDENDAVVFVSRSSSGKPGFAKDRAVLLGEISGPGLEVRYGKLDVWKIDGGK
jgi:4-amino-4-deoxy-L-arabinose transferase-like glycosyltransferase